MSKKLSNPISTGGGGPNFERAVDAYYLSCLLSRSVPRGLHIGTVEEVRFQQLFQGEPLDDLIVINKTSFGTAKLALQIKRDLTFGEKSETFDEVIQASWQTFLSEKFNRGTDRFGVCLNLYSKLVDEHYQFVLSWARNSANAQDFFQRISVKNLAHENQRNFVSLIRNKIDGFLGSKVEDHVLWEFLKAFVILRFDFHAAGSEEHNHTVELLKRVVSHSSSGNAESLFDKLANKYAAELNQSAGSINADILRQRLLTEDGFVLEASEGFTGDIDKLNQHSTLVLKNIKDSIGGIELNRVDETEGVVNLFNDHDCIGIVGPPGSGKSVILKFLAQNQLNQGGTIILSGDRISGTGWNSFASEIGLTASLPNLLSALNNTPEPTIFIDGLDRLLDPGSRQVVKDLVNFLEDIQKERTGFKKWKLILSTREENINDLFSWFDWSKIGSWTTYSVPELSDSQIDLISEHFPRIAPLRLIENLKPIIKNPLMLDLLIDKRMFAREEVQPPSIATEIELQNTWWERIVGSDTNYGGSSTIEGRNRQTELLRIGNILINSLGMPLVLNDSPPSVLLSLENDRILVRDTEREVHRFGHDLFEDWVLSRALNQHLETLPKFIQELGQPLGLYRPIQLVGTSILESRPVEDWLLLIKKFEENLELSPRWRQSLYSSPLISTRVYELLNKTTVLLINEDGRLLNEILIILRTVEITPDLTLLPFVSESDLYAKIGLIPSVLYTMPIPRWRVWFPFIQWLVENAHQIPVSIRHEVAKIFEIWQQRTPADYNFRREIGLISFGWLSETERWYERNA